MKAAASDGFAADFLNSEVADLKKTFKDNMQEFYVNIKQFATVVTPKVKALEAEQVRLQRMYLAGK